MRHDSISILGPDSAPAEPAVSTPVGTVMGSAEPTTGLLFSDLASRYLTNRELVGLKRTTLMDYESYARVHLVPAFGPLEPESITIELIEAFIAAKRQERKAVKSILNYLGLLHAIFAFGVRRGWCTRNPVALTDKPRGARNLDIRFLDGRELEALLDATPSDARDITERVLYLTAAMTGLRRGELLALRWQDIDWAAGVVRVRRNYTRGPRSASGTARLERRDFGVPDSCRPRLLPSPKRRRPRSRKRTEALPGRGETRRASTGAFSRSSPHLRDAHGGRRRPASIHPGMARTQRLPNHVALCRLRTRPLAGRVLGGTCLRQ